MLSGKDGVECAAETLSMSYSFKVDRKPILLAKVNKLSKNANIPTAIVRNKAMSTDTKKSLLRYARAFGKEFFVRFFDMRMVKFVEDEMS